MSSNNHQFNPRIAAKVGIEAAIIINNLKYWIEHNEAKKINFQDGRYWMYCSYVEMEKHLSYLDAQQIGRIMRKLEKKKIIRSGVYNKSRYDKTKWYTFTDEGWSIICECYIDDSKENNRKNQNEKPIQYSKTNEKSNNIDISGQATSFDVNAFYDASLKSSMLKMDEETKHNT